MTFDQFKIQVQRLTSTYGPNSYPQERVTLLWKEMERLEAHQFTAIVDSLISEERYPPMLDKFREMASVVRERVWSAEKRNKIDPTWNPRPACDYCRDNGTYVCTRKSHAGFWAFRCHCVRGDDDVRKMIPQFKSAHSAEYTYYDIVAARREAGIV